MFPCPDEEGGLREAMLPGQFLQQGVVQPRLKWTNARGVAAEDPVGKCIDPIEGQGHGYHPNARSRRRRAYASKAQRRSLDLTPAAPKLLIPMRTEVIGIDHIYVAVSDLARSEKFYDAAMGVLGFRKNTFLNEGDHHIQYFNRHFGFVLRPARSAIPHDPFAPGLHHFCFRVEDSAAVDAAAQGLGEAGITCSAPQLYPEYAPDYHAIFFSDPDGVRLEVTNFRQERRKRFAEL